MDVIKLILPNDRQKLAQLRAGQRVSISGTILTARDAAHQRLAALLEHGKRLPVTLLGETIYYTGPCPAPPGYPIGACGPTTSSRMDAYAPLLMEAGLLGMIGKGPRSQQVKDAIRRYGGAYLACLGGGGALLAGRVKRVEIAAFPELLSEAIYRLEVEDLPAIVAVDSVGGDIYQRR